MNGCPHCGGAATRREWTLGDRLFRTTQERFDVHRCDGCGIRFLHPVPSDLGRFYPEGYWTGPSANRGLHGKLTAVYRRAMLDGHARFVRRIARAQRKAGIPVSWLDVGCGDGSVLEAVGVRPCMGLDASLSALEQVQSRGIPAVRGSLITAPFRPRSFSIVSMFHFLEHVVPPESFLAAAHRLLVPGGSLIVQVPNAASWQAALLGRRWAGYDVPRHLVHYTPRHLRALVERAGFTVERTTVHSLRDNPTTLVNSFVPKLYPPARRPNWFQDLAYLALTLAAVPLTTFEALCGFGAAVMIEARPRQSA